MRLAKFKNLKILRLYDTQITDRGLENLKSLKELTMLNVEHTGVTSAAVESFRAALPKCFVWSEDSNRYFALWALAKGGTVAIVIGGSPDTVEVKETGTLPSRPFRVKECAFEGIVLGESDFAVVDKLFGLTKLSLENCQLTPLWLKFLGRFPDLASLRLKTSSVGDAGVTRIKGLTGLTDVSLIDAGITDAAMADLAELKNLVWLELTGNRGITDAGLEPLRSLTKLRTLLLEKTSVTAAGVAARRQCSPTARSSRPPIPIADSPNGRCPCREILDSAC